MIDKLALKRLTASDLTFFEWHFKNRNAGNQKAINLNADVFSDELYPTLEVAIRDRQNKLGIDLWIAGPAAAESINLQRKIIKGASYKNWRLDGEFVYNPDDAPDRFNILEPGDIALLGLEGELEPHTITLVLISATAPNDRVLYEGLNGVLGDHRMMALDADALRDLCEKRAIVTSHPVWLLLGNEDIVEAAAGHVSAIDRLLKRSKTARLSIEHLRKARRAAEEIGRLGEALVDCYLRETVVAQEITEYTWASDLNAIEPYDFSIQRGKSRERLEVKTTGRGFDRELHLPLSELREMAYGDVPYRIMRVYEASKDGAKARLSVDLREWGRTILAGFDTLPPGVTLSGVTVTPEETMFGGEIVLSALVADD